MTTSLSSICLFLHLSEEEGERESLLIYLETGSQINIQKSKSINETNQKLKSLLSVQYTKKGHLLGTIVFTKLNKTSEFSSHWT